MSARNSRPAFKLYAKLVLTGDGCKEYMRIDAGDIRSYELASRELNDAISSKSARLPSLALENGCNTRQAMSYGFKKWVEFFNDRQLLALSSLRNAILEVTDATSRDALLTLFSGVLEFNNLFASYKGEGTGAVRHMFSHHILKPEKMPIEANVWGTSKSSGSFSTLFPKRLLRALDYREHPTEIGGVHAGPRECSPAFSGRIEPNWPSDGTFAPRGIYLSCGNSANTLLPDSSIDLVVTDPPFFDNVHYSELADFFYAWQEHHAQGQSTTRNEGEVQDADEKDFANKLTAVFQECRRVLRNDGLMVFSYHHSRPEGWKSLSEAVLRAGFVVVNSHPVKAEMSVATPKSQAKQPIQFDIVLVCRKSATVSLDTCPTTSDALKSAQAKLQRLRNEGFQLSHNDCRIVFFGQLMTTLRDCADVEAIESHVDDSLSGLILTDPPRRAKDQKLLFE
jgi:putative DNA methylase